EYFQLVIYKGDIALAYKISPMYRESLQGQDIPLVVVEPATKPSHGPLGVSGATHHIRRPRCQADPPRLDQAYHHPCQGLEGALIHPLGMLAEDMHQRIIQMRCVLHASPP